MKAKSLFMKLFAVALTISMLLTVTACKNAATEETTEPVATSSESTSEAAATEAPATEVSTEPITLKVMHNWGEGDNKSVPLHAFFDAFEAMYPNVTIEEEVFSDKDIPTRVTTAFLAGEEPDIVFENLDASALDWPTDGVTIDMAQLAKDLGIFDQMKPAAVAEWTSADGVLRALPLEGYTWPIWYNTAILDQAGVAIPTTTDELINVAQKVREAGFQPFVTGGTDWTGQFVFYMTVASMLTDEEVRDLYSNGGFSNNANAVAGVELFVKLRDAGVFADGVEGMTMASSNEMFYSGQAAMMHAGSWFFAECPEDMMKNTVLGGFPLTTGSPHSKPIIYSSFEGKGVWVTRNGATKMDVVSNFIKLLYSPETMKNFVEQSAMTSPLIETPVDASKLNPLFVQSTTLSDISEVTMIQKVYVPKNADENIRRVANEAFVPGTPASVILANMDAVYADLG